MSVLKTENSNERESAAQMGAEDKGTRIGNGVMKMMKVKFPGGTSDKSPEAVGHLAALCGYLTSSDKRDREWAKKQVRELVKLGKEE